MFQTARLKLTAWYLAIIMLVSLSFSAVIYGALTVELEQFGRLQRSRFELRLKDGGAPFPFHDKLLLLSMEEEELIAFVKTRILTTLLVINGAILIISGGLGYILAGRTLRPIQDMVSEQNRFISDASHELRTPLTALKSTLEVNLRDKRLTLSSAKAVMQGSVQEVDALQSLSDSLLTLAQYEEPNGLTPFEKIQLDEVAREAIQKIAPIANVKGITIIQKLQQTKVTGDKASLIEAFVILLDNAIKYSKTAGHVTVQVQDGDDGSVFSVTDEGMGIAKADLPHIFDRFYRADRARTKTSRSGYGLGLAIAKKIVEVHRGSIRVTSKLGRGSTFTVIFS